MNANTNIQTKPSSLTQPRLRGRGRQAFWVVVLIGGAVALVSYLSGCTGHARHQRGFVAEDGPQNIHKGTEWALQNVDATQEQREKVGAILQELDADLVRWQEERQALKNRFVLALQGEQVNPEQLAKLKSDSGTLVDRALSRTVEVVLKVSEVLTPEQRKKLVANWRVAQ
jgi:Spy/CpxP family protein refolding chaperone